MQQPMGVEVELDEGELQSSVRKIGYIIIFSYNSQGVDVFSNLLTIFSKVRKSVTLSGDEKMSAAKFQDFVSMVRSLEIPYPPWKVQ